MLIEQIEHPTCRYKTLRIFHGCEVRIEQSVRDSLFCITRLCRVMPNSDPDWRIFLSAPNNHDRLFFVHTVWCPAYDFNGGVAFNESRSNTLTSAILNVGVVCDVSLMLTPNVRITWPPLQPRYWKHVLFFIFIYPTGRIRVCNIRFVSSGENRGKPCLVCNQGPWAL